VFLFTCSQPYALRIVSGARNDTGPWITFSDVKVGRRDEASGGVLLLILILLSFEEKVT